MRRTAAPALLAALLGAAAGAGEERVHVVREGESLSQIAARLGGDPACWPVIYRANRDQIKDPAHLHPGQRLTIPELTACPVFEPDPPSED